MSAPSVEKAAAAREPTIAPVLRSQRHEGELTFAEVWETIGDGVIVLSPEWRFVFVNGFAEQILGRPADSLLGRDHWDMFPHTTGTELERVYRRSVEERKRWDIEHQSNGRWYHIRTAPSRLGLTVTFTDITDRKIANSANELTQERFHVAAATPWLTLYEQDTNLRYTWLYPPHPHHANALGRTDREIVPDGSLAELEAKKREVIANGTPTRIEIRVAGTAGTRYYDTYIAPRRNAVGRIVGVTGAALEVTDRKLAEMALAENESRLRAAYTHAPVGIAEVDMEGRLISLNERYATQLGYRSEEMIGRSFGEYLHPEDRAESARDFALMQETGDGASSRERRYLHKSGRMVWLSVTRSLVRDADGQPKFAVAIATDVTERKLASLHQHLLYRLVASVNRAATTAEIYEAALEALCQSQGCSRGSILLCDGSGVMRFVAWRGLSDEYRAAVEGHSPWPRDVVEPQPVCISNVAECALDESLRAVVVREQIQALAFIPLTFEHRLLGKFMVYFDQPHQFAEEKLQMAETIARQVSFAIERRRAAEQLETLVRERTASLREAVQQMEEFSYTVSHDLRAPIRGMLTFANVILEDHAPTLSPEVTDYVKRIVKNAARMDALVRDTLAYSRVARGELEFTPVCLDDCVAQASAEVAPRGAVSVMGSLGHVRASEPLLMQVFTNLLGNAVKFVPRGTAPRVEVRAERRDGRVRVRVRDNGIGIPPHLHARVFAMFERLHPTAEYEGTGIGLAIVRKAVDRMGGQSGVESDGANGSTFWIELPAADAKTDSA